MPGNMREEPVDKLEIFRYNQKTQEWKTLRIVRTIDGDIFFRAEEGVKGGNKKSIIFKLTEQELAYLGAKAMKML